MCIRDRAVTAEVQPRRSHRCIGNQGCAVLHRGWAVVIAVGADHQRRPIHHKIRTGAGSTDACAAHIHRPATRDGEHRAVLHQTTREIQDTATRIDAGIRLSSDRTSVGARAAVAQRPATTCPVSYTHLDVYKRQCQQSSAASR